MSRFLPLSSRNSRSLLSLTHRRSVCRCKAVRSLWGMLLLLLTLTACEHRPLVDLNTRHYIRVYIDEQIQNVTCGFYSEDRIRPVYKRPVVLRVVLADPESGRMVTECFLQQNGEDERAYYLEGYVTAGVGDYHLMVYNYGTESALIHEQQNYWQMEAYTEGIAPHYYAYLPSVRAGADGERIVYEPDHLYLVTQEDIHIGYNNRLDTLRTSGGDYFTAVTCVDSYYIQVRIKGVEYVSTAASLLTGLSPAVTLHNRAMHPEEPVQIFFEMHLAGREGGVRSTDNGETVIYTTFNTFGKLPEVTTELEVTFDFVTVDGRTQTERMDITPLFDTPQVIDHKWIIIDREIVIEPPPKVTGGGGLSPEVNDYEDHEAEIEI